MPQFSCWLHFSVIVCSNNYNGWAQGFILDPLLFVMFINKFLLHINTCINLFADDTTLLASSNNVQDLENILLSEVVNVDEWATDNKLSRYCFKTKVIQIDVQNV